MLVTLSPTFAWWRKANWSTSFANWITAVTPPVPVPFWNTAWLIIPDELLSKLANTSLSKYCAVALVPKVPKFV